MSSSNLLKSIKLLRDELHEENNVEDIEWIDAICNVIDSQWEIIIISCGRRTFDKCKNRYSLCEKCVEHSEFVERSNLYDRT